MASPSSEEQRPVWEFEIRYPARWTDAAEEHLLDHMAKNDQTRSEAICSIVFHPVQWWGGEAEIQLDQTDTAVILSGTLKPGGDFTDNFERVSNFLMAELAYVLGDYYRISGADMKTGLEFQVWREIR